MSGRGFVGQAGPALANSMATPSAQSTLIVQHSSTRTARCRRSSAPNEEPDHLLAESRNAAVANVATRLFAAVVDPANLVTETPRSATERETVTPDPASGTPLKREYVTFRRSKGRLARRTRRPPHWNDPLLVASGEGLPAVQVARRWNSAQMPAHCLRGHTACVPGGGWRGAVPPLTPGE